MPKHSDVLVVGGGTAGCVVAARVATAGLSVQLLEAGPDPRPRPDIVTQPRLQRRIYDSELLHRYPAQRADGSSITFVGGRLLGGGSSVNQMSAVRPTDANLATWHEFGGPRWAPDNLQRALCRIERDMDLGHTAGHGANGPLIIRRAVAPGVPLPAATATLLAAAAQRGLPFRADVNTCREPGVYAFPYAIVDGKRWSAVDAYVDPVRHLPNLEIHANTQAHRLRIRDGRVAGVDVHHPDGPRTVTADLIVITAGAFQTPALLLRSGVGPADELTRLGIPAVVDLPGVGRNLQDHANIELRYALSDPSGPFGDHGKLHVLAASQDAIARPDIDISLRHADTEATATVRLLSHAARGRVTLESARSTTSLHITPALLEDPRDVDAITTGMRLIDDLLTDERLAGWYGPRTVPPADTSFADHARRAYGTYNHAVGTARLGRPDDGQAVVSGDLNLRGCSNVIIADASVLPTIPQANTNLSTMLVAELAADRILEDRGR